MLYVWSSAKDTLIQKCITSVLKRTKTNYRIIPVSPNIPKLKKGDVLMVCGGKAIETLSKAGVVPKNRTVGTLRGKVLPLQEGNVLCTYDPTILNIDPDKAGDIVWDTRLASRLEKTNSIVPKTGDYEWVDNYKAIIKILKAQYKETGKPVPISIDLETLGLTPHARGVWIISISVTIGVGKASLIYFKCKDSHKTMEGVISQIYWLNNAKEVRVRGANYKFDMLWQSVKWGINEFKSFTFDTNLVGSLLNENRSNSLNTHAKLYTSMGGYDDPFNTKHDKSRMDLVPKGELLEYGGGDTDACLRVSKVMLKELNKDKELKTFYSKLLLPCVQGCRVMEERGVLVDKERYRDLRNEVSKEIDKLQKQAFSKMSRRLRARYSDNLSLTRDVILREHLFTKSGLNLKPKIFTEKKKDPSTTLEHLELLAETNKEVVEFVDIMRDFNSAKKTLSTYIDGFMKHLRSDGKFHSTYMLYRGAYGNKNDDSGTVCVTKDTLFLTDRGQIPTMQVSIGQQIISHTGLAQYITDFIDNGMADITQVITKSGLSLKTNRHHPYMLIDGLWVEAQNLVVGDEVVTYGESESWKKIPDWQYEVSNWGRVRSLRNGVLKQHSKNKWGHLKVSLARGDSKRVNGNKKDFGVHQLVAKVWLNTKPKGAIIRHLNGIAWDNAYWNLAWGTQLENKQDDIKYGTASKAEHAQAKLNWAKVDYIHLSPLSDIEVAQELGVSRKLVSGVRGGTRWVRHTTSPKRVSFTSSVITDINQLPEEHTYGITVSIDSSHITNGIVTHNTGRTSAKDPAYQTIPKHTKWAKPLRSVYIAPPGYVHMNVDYSQGELRIAACIANEISMIKAYKQGIDMHLITGAEVFGLTLQEALRMKKKGDPQIKIIRQGGKAGNFGLIYGMQAKGFVNYAKTSYGVDLTLVEAENFRTRFFESKPRLLPWHEEAKETARQFGSIRTPLGRVRHLPSINSSDNELRAKQERQSLNSPVQATLSDLGLLAMGEIYKRYPQLWCYGFTHDALTFYVPEDEVDVWAQRTKNVMENLPLAQFGWKPQLQFPVDVEVSTESLADLEEYEIT